MASIVNGGHFDVHWWSHGESNPKIFASQKSSGSAKLTYSAINFTALWPQNVTRVPSLLSKIPLQSHYVGFL